MKSFSSKTFVSFLWPVYKKFESVEPRHFVENALRLKRAHAPTFTQTQTKCGPKVSLGDYHFTQ